MNLCYQDKLRKLSEYGIPQNRFEEQHSNGCKRKWEELFAVTRIGTVLDLGFFHLVYFLVNGVETFVVFGPEIPASGFCRDLCKQLFINAHFFPLHYDPCPRLNRYLGISLTSHADGIHPYADRFGDFLGSIGVNKSPVIFSV